VSRPEHAVDELEDHAVIAQAFCTCHHLLQMNAEGLLSCVNRQCMDQGKKFKLHIELIEVETTEYRC
jgi:aspartate carbamoyltransferase regulatory subunit